MSSGTDKIVSSIMSEAQEKADVIIQDANADASAITAKAEKTAEAEKIKILENGKKQSDMRYQQIISEAKMNARRAKLGAKEEVIEAAFNQATGELKAKAADGDDDYKDSLAKMIQEAASEIGHNDLIIHLNEADTNTFKQDLSSSDSFEIDGIKFTLGEPIKAIGGAILKTSNGDIEVNNTIEARLERYKSILRLVFCIIAILVVGAVVVIITSRPILDIYPYLNPSARVRARKGRLFDEKQISEIVETNNIEEVENYLKGIPEYADVLDEYPLDKALDVERANTYDFVARLAPKDIKDPFVVMSKKADIDNIKSLLTAKEVGLSADETRELLIPCGSLYEDLESLADAGDVTEIVTSLDNTEYATALEDALPQ